VVEGFSETRKAIEDAKQAIIRLQRILHRNEVDEYIDFEDIFRCLIFQDGYVLCAEHNKKTDISIEGEAV